MPRFINELKELLYNSHVHDAKLEKLKYNCEEDSVKIELCNPFFDVRIGLTFFHIEVALAMKGKWPGSRETVLSLTVEEDLSVLRKHLIKDNESMEDSLCLLFQMFSGDELYIAAKEVLVEIIG